MSLTLECLPRAGQKEFSFFAESGNHYTWKNVGDSVDVAAEDVGEIRKKWPKCFPKKAKATPEVNRAPEDKKAKSFRTK